MELIEGSETSANHNLTPGKYPKEYIQKSYPFCIIFIMIVKHICIINIVIIMFVNGVKRILPHLFCVAGPLSTERPVPRV
jgi:hypothetical protein